MDVKKLTTRVMEAMESFGLTKQTVWAAYTQTFLPIIRLHELEDECDFNREIVTKYVKQIEGRYEQSEIGLDYYRNLKRAAQRLTEMNDNGRLDWSAPSRKSGFILNKYYEKVAAGFVCAGNFSPKGISDATWISRKYFAWLILEGHNKLTKVGVNEIQGFMIHCSHHMVSSSVHNVKLYMKKLYAYLASAGYAKNDYSELFEFTVSRECRLFPALPPEEIAMILELIDRRTPKGKRDYAVMLLGVVMGLRAVDIARLRLSDIDWQKGEIKIVQAKTGNSLALPLTNDVGEAIKDYILRGRQTTVSDAVFVGMRAPHKAFSNGVAIGDMYDYYRIRAGLPRDAFDGKGFHALRRTVGKGMVTSGVPVTMVAQVLGDEDINSTKKYIALDSKHLKECALDFSGIEPERGHAL